MSNEAVALIGFVSLFALMLLRVPVGMAMGLVGITGFGYLTGFAPGAEAGRPDHDAHGDGLFLRRDPDVPVDGRVRVGLRHQPRTVPRRQHLCRPLEGRARHRHYRRLRRLRRDFGLLGRDRRDVLRGRLSGNAPLRLSAILRHRRDRGRRHARARCCRRPPCWRSTASSPSRISANCSSPASCPDCWRSRCT